MINEQIFSWIVHLLWKMFSLCSSLVLLLILRALLVTNISPLLGSASTSSPCCSSIKQISLSSSTSFSWKARYLAKVMTFRLGQSEPICPKPWHLKHLLWVAGLGGGLFYRVAVFRAIWDEFPVVLGFSWGIPLLKAWFLGKGLGGSFLISFVIFVVQLCLPTHMHPQMWCAAAVQPHEIT